MVFSVVRELRRLSWTPVKRSALQLQGGLQDWKDRREPLRQLRLAARQPGEGSEDSGAGDDLQDGTCRAPRSTTVFAHVDGGDAAVDMLFGPRVCEGNDEHKAIVTWIHARANATAYNGPLDPAGVLLARTRRVWKDAVVARALNTVCYNQIGVVYGCTLRFCLHLPVNNDSQGREKDAPLPDGTVLVICH